MQQLLEGQFLGDALDIEFGKTSTGKDQCVISFKVLDLDGKSVKMLQTYRVFEGDSEETTEKMRSMRMTELEAIGFSWDTMKLPATPKRVGLVINIEPDLQNVDRERIAFINDLSRARMKQVMGEGEKLAFQARMRGYAAGRPQPATSQAGDAAEPAGSALAASGAPEPWEDEPWAEKGGEKPA